MSKVVKHIKTKQARKKGGKAASVNSVKARSQAKKIVEALREAEQVHKGKRKGKTFNEFLGEL